MSSRRYDYIMVRVDYPRERGYRMEARKLPNYMHITIDEHGDSKQLTVHSRIHVNKEVKVSPTYSPAFSDIDILRDLSGKISYMFLN